MEVWKVASKRAKIVECNGLKKDKKRRDFVREGCGAQPKFVFANLESGGFNVSSLKPHNGRPKNTGPTSYTN